MKTRLFTLLAVGMFVALGILNASRTNAHNAEGSTPAQALRSMVAAPAAVAAPANNWDFQHNRGRITRIYPEPTGVYFTFGGKPSQWQTAMNPANGYYYIPLTHPNYKTLVDLLYLAAEHDWNLQARTHTALGVAGRAEVIYLVQDFSRQ